jgi:hypothetical protein
MNEFPTDKPTHADALPPDVPPNADVPPPIADVPPPFGGAPSYADLARSLSVRATFAVTGVVAAAVAALLDTAAQAAIYLLSSDGGGTETGRDSGLRILASGLSALSGLVFVGAGIAYIFWLHRARTNLDALGETGLRWRPGWTIGGWVIPLANFVIPLFVVNEIDRAGARRAAASHGPAGRPTARAVFAPWATTWTLYLIVSQVTDRVTAATGSESAMWYSIMDTVTLGLAAVFAVPLVRQITANLRPPAADLSGDLGVVAPVIGL